MPEHEDEQSKDERGEEGTELTVEEVETFVRRLEEWGEQLPEAERVLLL